MKKTCSTLTLGLLLVLQTIAFSSYANEALADKNTCLNCHDVSKKMVGPAFKAISEKYKGRADANTYLTEKIIKGGTGVWGNIPMPPMTQVSEADAKALAAWIAKGPN
jgi:cytochrome c551/c552